jgi:hypothetical protein
MGSNAVVTVSSFPHVVQQSRRLHTVAPAQLAALAQSEPVLWSTPTTWRGRWRRRTDSMISRGAVIAALPPERRLKVVTCARRDPREANRGSRQALRAGLRRPSAQATDRWWAALAALRSKLARPRKTTCYPARVWNAWACERGKAWLSALINSATRYEAGSRHLPRPLAPGCRSHCGATRFGPTSCWPPRGGAALHLDLSDAGQ